jgi:hypothetical protein
VRLAALLCHRFVSGDFSWRLSGVCSGWSLELVYASTPVFWLWRPTQCLLFVCAEAVAQQSQLQADLGAALRTIAELT